MRKNMDGAWSPLPVGAPLGAEALTHLHHLRVPADPSGWWTGRLRGKQGLFPNNYVTKI